MSRYRRGARNPMGRRPARRWCVCGQVPGMWERIPMGNMTTICNRCQNPVELDDSMRMNRHYKIGSVAGYVVNTGVCPGSGEVAHEAGGETRVIAAPITDAIDQRFVDRIVARA